ncbi:MAG: NTP transferase domain-containing protein [Saprospiraceae bacterium]|nr:NTP transferase domain-containing protein [Saprospiraceae bacterium]
MKIIIPMAGRGSRLRPHTLTVPKPLIPIAGKPMVQRLVEDLSATLPEKVEEIAFIIGDFGETVEQQLKEIAANIGAKGSIYHQEQPLGPGHAILCAAPSLSGKCIVAFSDTLFKANFNFNSDEDGIIWVQKVDNPASFGVIKLNDDGIITDFVEKPSNFISDKAIVGIYYFKDGGNLKAELQYLIDHDVKEKGEYQLTTALEHMKQKGLKFRPSGIEEWLDCGNKDNVLDTNTRILQLKVENENLVHDSVITENTVIIPPCCIGANTVLRNTVVGPHVSIGDHCVIENSILSNTLIQNHTNVDHANLQRAMLGSHVQYDGKASDVSLGDYSSY